MSRSPRSRAIAAAALVLAAASASACSTAGSVTCQDFGQRTSSDRSSLVRELIGAHGLDWTSNIIATASIQNSIEEYCGISSIQEFIGKKVGATKNLSASIDAAINWDDYRGK